MALCLHFALVRGEWIRHHKTKTTGVMTAVSFIHILITKRIPEKHLFSDGIPKSFFCLYAAVSFDLPVIFSILLLCG